MDAFRAEAEQQLQDLLFVSANNQYNVTHISSSLIDHKDTKFEDKVLNDADLRSFIDCSTPMSDIVSTKFVHMYYHPDRGVTAAPSIFRHLWHSFHLDPYMVHMFSRNVPGFFQLPFASPPDDRLLNFYINCSAHWILWTYDTEESSTNALLLSRDSPGGPAAYPMVHTHLERYSSLSGHPLFLALVFALERIAYVDRFLKEQHKRIGRVEKYTGFSHFHIDKPLHPIRDAEEELAQLSELSRLASSVLSGLADMMQHLQSSETMLNAILSFSLPTSMSGIDGIVTRDTEIKHIAKLLDPQLKQRSGYLNYIKQRAENQLTVIFNLLARGDAQATINIAKATMHDSTSMKTIAIMTMGFLPATFWAALFAVPSLHWDQPTVIGSRFWVYWAITIPTTISVFVAWFAIMNRDTIWMKMRSKKGKRRHLKHTREKTSISTKQLNTFA